jgi:hypothetical protein
MSETIVAPARRWIDIHVDVISKHGVEIIQATPKQVEYAMIKFAQAHVKKALEAANNLSREIDIIFAEGNPLLTVYPIENIK